jgi:putative spermidine/putrescine transport system permease protein
VSALAQARRRLPRTTSVLTVFGVVMLALPTVIILAASLTKGTNIVFPPRGITLHWYDELLSDEGIRTGLLHSLYVAAVAVVVDTVAGVLAALALAGPLRRGAGLARIFLSLGIMTPIVVSAFAFYTVALDLRLSGNLTLVGIGIAVVVFPFMLWTLSSALADRDPTLVDAAATMGADPVEQFLFVTLPLLTPAIVTGALLVFVLSITDFLVSLVLTNVDTQTLPVVIYSGLRSNVSPLLGAATVLFIGVAAIVCAIVLRIGRLERSTFGR